MPSRAEGRGLKRTLRPRRFPPYDWTCLLTADGLDRWALARRQDVHRRVRGRNMWKCSTEFRQGAVNLLPQESQPVRLGPSRVTDRQGWRCRAVPDGAWRKSCFRQCLRIRAGLSGAWAGQNVNVPGLTLALGLILSLCVSLNGNVHRPVCHPVIESGHRVDRILGNGTPAL